MTFPSSLHKVPAKLVLKNGDEFFGFMDDKQRGTYKGEAVFSTGMTGYPESLTDPSYAGQILCFTYPLIGNYGVPEKSLWESDRIHAKAVVVSELCHNWEHRQGKNSFHEWLIQQHIPLIFGVDTRALTKSIRAYGAMPAILTTEDNTHSSFEDFETQNFMDSVSIKDRLTNKDVKNDKVIFALDCGMKENIWRILCKSGATVHRVPYNYDFTDQYYDGVFISNGPGNPALLKETTAIVKKAMQKNKPIFGICLGTQIMAIAAGGETYKLPFGHRGHNHPCIEVSTNRCFITSKNHGYAVDENSLNDEWEISFRNLNDGTVAGIRHKKKPYFAVQFHPEAAPGPVDTNFLFEKFFDLL